MIQNAAARLVFNQPKRAHVTPLLIELHWLPVAARIKFKSLMLAHRVIAGSSHTYLNALVRAKLYSTLNGYSTSYHSPLTLCCQPGPLCLNCSGFCVAHSSFFIIVTTRAGEGPLFSPGISGPRPAHFFHGS